MSRLVGKFLRIKKNHSLKFDCTAGSKQRGEMRKGSKIRWRKDLGWSAYDEVGKKERRYEDRAHLDTNFHFLSPLPGDSVPELRKTQQRDTQQEITRRGVKLGFLRLAHFQTRGGESSWSREVDNVDVGGEETSVRLCSHSRCFSLDATLKKIRWAS